MSDSAFLVGLFLSLVFRENVLLVLDVLKLPFWDLPELSSFLVHCNFGILNNHRFTSPGCSVRGRAGRAGSSSDDSAHFARRASSQQGVLVGIQTS